MDSVSEFDLSNTLRLAHRAMLLVARGASERNAVARVAASDPDLANVKREALVFVMGTISKQDLLDRLVQDALPGTQLGISVRLAFRLASYCLLRSTEKRHLKKLERSLRDIVPTGSLPQLELLLGALVGSNEHHVLSGLDDSEKVAMATHHPVWWVKYCFRLFGRSSAIELLSAGPRPRYLRINPLKNGGKTTLPKQAKDLADKLVKVPSTRGVYSIGDSSSAFSRFFSQGIFQVQDLASYLAVKAGDPKPGEDVLDLCAAPGAKTAALAQLMKNRGRIVSVDYSPRRMGNWLREVNRLGVRIAEPVISDATRLGLRKNFDLVIIDPPCSGTGVFDRYPSMKWHLSPQSLERYSALQEHILDSATSLVSEGGRILYCTCSITVEENEEVIEKFLRSHLEFEIRPLPVEQGSPGLRGMVDARRLYQHRDRTAGYFIARMERAS